MPTAARITAALCLAALAWLVSDLIKPLFDEDKNFGSFNLVNFCIGFLVGWKVVGSRVGRGVGAAINNGLTGGAVALFWVLLVHSFYRMFRISMRGRYDGALDAGGAAFKIMADYALLIATPTIILTFVAGSALVGLIAELVSRRAS
ncbi:TrgA family protein [Planktotalea arctica]|uniref:TrgA family protein n=1 Tax=Planktotalea arctica TaxID=1481893 RepID=UPI003219DA63